jgi:ferric-dicitrate binding protein FerR (iron transport regulator)
LVVYLVGLAAWITLSPPVWMKYTTSIGGYQHITLADGSSIQLNTNTDQFLDVAFGRNPVSRSALQEGDAAAVRPEGLHLTRIGLEELNRKLSWTAGLLSFQGETLAEVDQFNRYNRKHLVVADPAITTRRIGGAFQATDPDSFVSGLQKWFGIHADDERENSGSGIIRLTAAK